MERLKGIDRRDGSAVEVALRTTRLTIGAGPSADLRLVGNGIGDDHAVLELVAAGWKVVDRHAEAGTVVNGEFVAQRALRSGDVLEIGPYRLVFETIAGAPSPAPTAVRKPPAVPPSAPSPAVLPQAPARDPRTASGVASASSALRRRPRRAGPSSVGTAALLLVILGVSLAAFLVLSPDRAAHAQREARIEAAGIERVRTLRDAGRFELAAIALVDLEGSTASSATLATERDAIDRARGRAARAAELLEAIPSESGAPEQRHERATRAAADHADTPFASRFATLLRRTALEVRQAELARGASLLDRIVEDVKRQLEGRFGAARVAWQESHRRDLLTERFVAAAAIEAAELGAGVLAAAMVSKAEAAIATGDDLTASVVLDDQRIEALRGAVPTAELEGLLEVVEARLKGLGSGLVARREPPAGRDPAAGGSSSPGSPSPPSASPSAPVPGGPAGPPVPAVPHAPSRYMADRPVLTMIDRTARSGDVAGSIELATDAYAKEANDGARQRLEWRLERGQRALAFVASLGARIAANPNAVASVAVATRDGAAGRIETALPGPDGSAQFALRVEGGEPRPIKLLELDPKSCLLLAKRYTWSPAEHLDRAFFALAFDLAADADAAIEQAAPALELKLSLDRAIVLLRGLDEMPEWGFFRIDGKWLTFAERAKRDAENQVLAAIAKLDRGGTHYQAGLDELAELLAVAREAIARELAARRKKLLAQVAAAPEWKSLDGLYAERQKLDAARAHALELIFDEVRYFYPYTPPEVPPDVAKTYPEVQREVDARVEKVRAIWGNEHGEPAKGISLSPKFQGLLEMLDKERGTMLAADPDTADIDAAMGRLELLPRGTAQMTLRDVAVDLTERQRLDRDAEVLTYNTKVVTSAVEAELRQVRITNDYRLMFGRGALAVNEKVMRAARGHSDWMSRTGRFSHFNDMDQALRTPGDRMKREGYVGGGGENIAIADGPDGAHRGWIGSSGHHRNLLWAGHSEMGVGGVGRYWTQNFGGSTEYLGNLGDL
jgi:uncharacterized protein YkwD